MIENMDKIINELNNPGKTIKKILTNYKTQNKWKLLNIIKIPGGPWK